jgi:hypothetical protein
MTRGLPVNDNFVTQRAVGTPFHRGPRKRDRFAWFSAEGKSGVEGNALGEVGRRGSRSLPNRMWEGVRFRSPRDFFQTRPNARPAFPTSDGFDTLRLCAKRSAAFRPLQRPTA